MQVKTAETDGYSAIQLGFEEVAERKLTKRPKGPFGQGECADVALAARGLCKDAAQYTPGDVIKADIFEDGDYVDVVGRSKGKGFAGAVKRHGFGGGPKTHGQSDRQRATGLRGRQTSPGPYVAGCEGSWPDGQRTLTVQNLKIALVDAERNLIAIRAVPGARGSVVLVREAIKRSKA